MEGLALSPLGGMVLALHPREELAKDVGLSYQPSSFSGLTMAYNAESEQEVDVVLSKVKSLGGTIIKPAQEVYLGSYSGYFKDLYGYVFDVAYNPLWEFDKSG